MVIKIKTIMKAASIIFLILTINNCSKIAFWKDDELSISKTPYTGNQLRIDGYYFQLTPNIEWTETFFFYRNGIVLKSYINNDTGLFETVISFSKLRYGVFEISNENIKFEKWYPSSPGEGFPAYVRSGHILNDTTFVITESYRMKKGKKTEVDSENETYHFRQFSPKPDSTNSFIK
jgi:hypothetical protein